jgi:hypothetical protein
MNKTALIVITFFFIAISASMLLFMSSCGQNGTHFEFMGSSSCPMSNGQFHVEKWRSTFQSTIGSPVLVVVMLLLTSSLLVAINKTSVVNTQRIFYIYYIIKKIYRGIKPFDPLRLAFSKGIIIPLHFG